MDIIGIFQIESGKIVLSDPCYEADGHSNVIDLPAKTGKWLAFIERERGGGRVAKLIAIHEDAHDCHSVMAEPLVGHVGVDSGQAGVYDQEHFKDDSLIGDDFFEGIPESQRVCVDEPWYSANCARSLGVKSAGIIPFGCVSSSGYGDGYYRASGTKEGDEYIYFHIEFVDDKEDEEDYDEEDDDYYE